ncbi:hypothetical protein FQR65_LT03882 [Abscondita terminalis]|nr:hypothetical protein FQR65_LT03882 [Abscondita terminalis]
MIPAFFMLPECCSSSPPAQLENPCPEGVAKTEILAKGGSAVDAAIAALFIEGVVHPHATGIGGSCMFTIYDNVCKEVKTITARGAAPGAANESTIAKIANPVTERGRTVCVPGLVRGCWWAHEDYGKLPWADLIQPAARLCKEGFPLCPYLESVMFLQEDRTTDDEELNDYCTDPCTGCPYKIGNTIRNCQLGKSLCIIAKQGESAMYSGELSEKLITDLKNVGGILSADDFKKYLPIWGVPVSTTLPSDRIAYSVDAPGSGAVLLLMLNMFDGTVRCSNLNTTQNWHKIVEVFKFGMAARTRLGDGVFDPCVNCIVDTIVTKNYASAMKKRITFFTHSDPVYYGATKPYGIDHGSSNIVVFGTEGDAAVVTSTIGQNFGSAFMSSSTGIVLNDEMHDFSIPSECRRSDVPNMSSNFIAPGKRPVSSMAPMIVMDKNQNVVFGIGAAGGVKSTVASALVTLRHLFCGEPIAKAISAKRLLHQLYPSTLIAELGVGEKLLRELMRLGHDVEIKMTDGFVAVTAMSKTSGYLSGSFDPRRGGAVELI